MSTRAVILAGGTGARMGVLTAKRTKPAVPFAGKYRIIDFPLSNCVNSNLFNVVIITQYRPHSLIDHIKSGAPWDLNRDFTGGVRIFTPYTARYTGWFAGTADALQQNFGFIKHGHPDRILVLSGDQIYTMNYEKMIDFHRSKNADVTIATMEVPIEDAHRFGVLSFDGDYKITSFVEKPDQPKNNTINMGIYLFECDILDQALWEDQFLQDSSHDFGKDVIPAMINSGKSVYAFPYKGYWADVGTVSAYWYTHMDLIKDPPPLNLHDRSWIIHTRTEERPPVLLRPSSIAEDSMISDGCVIEPGAKIIRSILSPGVHVKSGAEIIESIIFTDAVIKENAIVKRTIIDKRANIGAGARLGDILEKEMQFSIIGKNSTIPDNTIVEPGGQVSVDVVSSDIHNGIVRKNDVIQTRRIPYEI